MFGWTEWPLLLLRLLFLLVFAMRVLHCGWPTICIFNIIIRCRCTSEPTSAAHSVASVVCAVRLHFSASTQPYADSQVCPSEVRARWHAIVYRKAARIIFHHSHVLACRVRVKSGSLTHSVHRWEEMHIVLCHRPSERERKREARLRLCGWDRNQRACLTLCKIQRIQTWNMLFYVFGCFYTRFSFHSSLHYVPLVRMWMNFVEDIETESKRSVLVRYSMISDSMFPART